MQNNLTVWAILADGFINGTLCQIKIIIPGTVREALDAGEEEYFDRFNQYPTFISAWPATHATVKR